jgi:hypothetical protein
MLKAKMQPHSAAFGATGKLLLCRKYGVMYGAAPGVWPSGVRTVQAQQANGSNDARVSKESARSWVDALVVSAPSQRNSAGIKYSCIDWHSMMSPACFAFVDPSLRMSPTGKCTCLHAGSVGTLSWACVVQAVSRTLQVYADLNQNV